MKAEEFRQMAEGAIQSELADKRKGLLMTRCQVALGEEVHPHQIRHARKDIARMLTVLNEKKSAQGGKE